MLNIQDYSHLYKFEKRQDIIKLKEYIGNIDGTLHIPDGVTIIGQKAFAFSKIKEIVLPSTINKIGKGAFDQCINLKKVVINKLNSNLINDIFINDNYYSYNLERNGIRMLSFRLFFGEMNSIELTDFSMYYDFGETNNKFIFDNMFVLYGNKLIGYLGKDINLILPEKTKTIKENAFKNNHSISSIRCNSDLKEIESYAFNNCSNLSILEFNNGLKKLGNNLIKNTKITKLIIPATVNDVGGAVFSGAQCLNELIIDKTLADVKKNWFKLWDLSLSIIPKFKS